ncbi:MAG: hypothetical protein LRY71_11845 [Bacillaceae bacterium]|nr:hypothetical protein [Bacillaceae bacterium]
MNIEDDNSIKDIVSFFNCKTLLDLKLESLSIGQLLKVKLMKAYLASPFVLIIDQPFYRLTNTERLEVLSAIKEMKKHMSKIAIVIFCQYVKEWFPICNHFVIFSEHKIQQVGTKEELLTQPTNAFVAAFVYGNKISFLRGTVNFGIFTCGKLEFPIPTNIQLPSNLEDLIIAITPDQFVLVDFSTAKVDVEAFIPVYIIEKGIESNYLYSNISGQTIIAEFQKNDRIEEGMLIKVGLSLHNVLLFDGRTKNRLVKKE